MPSASQETGALQYPAVMRPLRRKISRLIWCAVLLLSTTQGWAALRAASDTPQVQPHLVAQASTPVLAMPIQALLE